MKALSIRAPWWYAILHAGKDIENRSWPTNLRGRVLIQASTWWGWEEIQDDWETIKHIRVSEGHLAPVAYPQFTWRNMQEMSGCIVGSVEIVDCVRESKSPWFFGRYGFVLRDPEIISSPNRVKGALGFFEAVAPESLTTPH